MEQTDIDNTYTGESFETLKGTCKSRVDLIFYLGLSLSFLIALAILITLSHIKIYGLDITHLIVFIALGSVWGMMTLNNYHFRKKADNLITPEQLLHTYEKTVQNNTKLKFTSAVLINCYFIFTFYNNGRYSWLWLTLLLIILAVGILLYYKNELVSKRDKEIIRVLKELTEEEQARR